MIYGGLRGAVAYYIALNLHTPYKDILQTATIVIIFFTVIGLGNTTNIVLRILNY
jgi:NhaP-type Na+/H+ or K+/H+ antiporter